MFYPSPQMIGCLPYRPLLYESVIVQGREQPFSPSSSSSASFETPAPGAPHSHRPLSLLPVGLAGCLYACRSDMCIFLALVAGLAADKTGRGSGEYRVPFRVDHGPPPLGPLLSPRRRQRRQRVPRTRYRRLRRRALPAGTAAGTAVAARTE